MSTIEDSDKNNQANIYSQPPYPQQPNFQQQPYGQIQYPQSPYSQQPYSQTQPQIALKFSKSTNKCTNTSKYYTTTSSKSSTN